MTSRIAREPLAPVAQYPPDLVTNYRNEAIGLTRRWPDSSRPRPHGIPTTKRWSAAMPLAHRHD